MAGSGAGLVGSAVSGVGLLLLLGGLGAYVNAEVNKRDALQRWAGRSYFGKDKPPQAALQAGEVNRQSRFRNHTEEDNWLMALYDEMEHADDIAGSNKREQRGIETPKRGGDEEDKKDNRPDGNFGIYG